MRLLEALLSYFPAAPVYVPPVTPIVSKGNDMSIELKIKSKHLGLEAKVIRHEEKKLQKQIRFYTQRQAMEASDPILKTFYSIHNHRTWDVRNENRATFLARAYLAGKSYESVEKKVHNKAVLEIYILPRVVEMVNKYGPESDRMKKVFNPDRRTFSYKPEDLKAFRKKISDWMGL